MQLPYKFLIMKRKNHYILLLTTLFLASILFVSCQVDFDPNSHWTETTIVYGVLDQDSDTSFLRIQKCFVGEGNYLEFAKEKDSIYYKQDELEVRIYSFYPWDTNGWDISYAHKKYEFIYTESYTKPEGGFYSEISPIYYCVTKNNLPSDDGQNPFVYRLEIRNLRTGNIVNASTYLVADYKITKPEGNQFGFPSIQNVGVLTSGWITQTSNSKGEMARLFQPSIRFHFLEDNNPTYIDINYSPKFNPFQNKETEITYKIYGDNFLYELENIIRARGMKERKFMYGKEFFELFIYGCNRDLYEYITNNETTNSLVERPLYTNINNGIGIFASRRLKIKKGFIGCDSRLETAIRSLKIGFNN